VAVKTERDEIANLLKLITEYEGRGVRVAARDKIGCAPSEFRKQHVLATLERYLKNIKAADKKNIFDRITQLDQFLIEVFLLEKAFVNDTGLKKIVDDVWQVRNHIADNLILPMEQKILLDEAKTQHRNQQLADPLIKHLKLLHSRNHADDQFRVPYLTHHKMSLKQAKALEKIKVYVLNGQFNEALEDIDKLSQFLHKLPKNADNTLTMQVLNNLQTELKKASPEASPLSYKPQK
jgi:hypothetical protein